MIAGSAREILRVPDLPEKKQMVTLQALRYEI